MKTYSRPVKPEPAFLAFISVWEAVALITGRVPTVTTVVSKLPRNVRAVLTGATAFWLFVHFEIHRR